MMHGHGAAKWTRLSPFACALALLAACGAREEAAPAERVRRAAHAVETGLADDLAAANLSAGDPIFIRIFKEERELEVWLKGADRFRLVRMYEICSYSGELGPKLREGDRQSPEGFYFVTPGQMNPNSRYHLSFNIGYPNAYDRARGRTGGQIMVHGDCVSIGCYAMTDAGIEEIYGLADAALRHGQPSFRVHVFPFRMSVENMTRHSGSGWYDFWDNLKLGYDLFERHRIPPNVHVEGERYVFDDPASHDRMDNP